MVLGTVELPSSGRADSSALRAACLRSTSRHRLNAGAKHLFGRGIGVRWSWHEQHVRSPNGHCKICTFDRWCLLRKFSNLVNLLLVPSHPVFYIYTI